MEERNYADRKNIEALERLLTSAYSTTTVRGKSLEQYRREEEESGNPPDEVHEVADKESNLVRSCISQCLQNRHYLLSVEINRAVKNQQNHERYTLVGYWNSDRIRGVKEEDIDSILLDLLNIPNGVGIVIEDRALDGYIYYKNRKKAMQAIKRKLLRESKKKPQYF